MKEDTQLQDINIPKEDKRNFNPTILKKEKIVAFLNHIEQQYSEPMVGYSEDSRRVTVFGCKEDVFSFFMTGFHDGIHGDFQNLVALNYESPVSLDYFIKIWAQYKPSLFTESDRPQCSECMSFDLKIKDEIKSKNMSQVLQLKEEKTVFSLFFNYFYYFLIFLSLRSTSMKLGTCFNYLN